MPDEMGYDESRNRLLVGSGFIDNVPPAVWRYEVSGKRVLTQWFSYRKKNRERPIIGDRRPPPKLGEIQPDHWLAESTTELLNVLMFSRYSSNWNPPRPGFWRRSVKDRHLISVDGLRAAGALDVPPAWRKSLSAGLVQRDLFSDLVEDEEPDPDDQAPPAGDEDADEDFDQLP